MTEELPEGWASARLADLVEPIEVTDPTRTPDAVFRYIDIGSIDNEALRIGEPKTFSGKEAPSRARRVVREGDVLFSTVRPYLRNIALAGAAHAGCLTSTGITVLRAQPSVLPGYLFRLVSSHAFVEEVGRSMDGTLYPAVRDSDVLAASIPLPPLVEQRRIVARIEALFARTRQARADLLRVTPLSDRYRLALLRSALRGELTADWRRTAGALEPAARLIARTPTPTQPRGGREATDEVIPGVAALSVNNPQTEPPPGWAWVPLLRLARQESGHTPSRGVAAYWNGAIPWIGIRDAGAHHGGVITDTAQHVTQAGLDNSSARLLPAQTVCLSRTASVGYVVMMGRSMATSQDFVTWTCSPALLPDFLKYALLAEGDDIRRFGKGSTHTTIYFPEIRALHICLPSLAEQQEIVRILDQALPATGTAGHDATRALALLGNLERSILTRAFRGELVPQDPADKPAAVALASAQDGAPDRPRRGRPRRAA